MGGFSLMHWIVVAVVLILVLGGGRFSNMMGDVAKGLKQFKKGMEEDDAPTSTSTSASAPKPPVRLQAQPSLEPASERDLRPMPEDRPHG